MKPLIIPFLILFLSISPSARALSVTNSTDLSIVIACEMHGLLYKITAEFRDKKIPMKQALVEVKKLTKNSPEVAVDVVADVYGKYKMKSPDWLEGFFHGTCLVDVISNRIEPPQQNDVIPFKKINPKLIM